jgi:uncharacterized protein YecT (DUF1311 family)
MKGTRTLSTLAVLCLFSIVACSKSNEKKDVAAVAQDTMLMHDLAEANRNTAAAEATDTTGAVVAANTRNGLGAGALTSGSVTTNTSGTGMTTPRASTQTPRITAPTGSGDARGPTNVSATMDSNSSPSSRSSSGDPCDSPSMSDQRSCLNRAIATNDADLNRVYRDLISQARTSGGDDLEERFRQSQRDWVNRRDVECRQQTNIEEGKTWARGMARCLAEYSNRRTSELQSSLNRLRGQQ